MFYKTKITSQEDSGQSFVDSHMLFQTLFTGGKSSQQVAHSTRIQGQQCMRVNGPTATMKASKGDNLGSRNSFGVQPFNYRNAKEQTTMGMKSFGTNPKDGSRYNTFLQSKDSTQPVNKNISTGLGTNLPKYVGGSSIIRNGTQYQGLFKKYMTRLSMKMDTAAEGENENENEPETDNENEFEVKHNNFQRVVIVRHANSAYNYAVTDQEYLSDAERDPYLIDAPLTELGIQQCKDQVDQALWCLPNLSLVITSPLKRALETAYLLFKDHPNFENMTFLLDPDLREGMNSPCDVCGPIEDTLKEYRDKLPNIDTSILDAMVKQDRNLWFLENLQEDKQIALKRMIKENPDKPYQEVVLDAIHKHSMGETPWSRDTRISRSLYLIKSKLKDLPEDAQIACVGHSVYFSEMTGGKHLENCEIFGIDSVIENSPYDQRELHYDTWKQREAKRIIERGNKDYLFTDDEANGEKPVDIYSLMQDTTFWLSVNKTAVRTIDTEVGGENFTHIAAIESNGHVQGSYLSTHFGKPFVPIQKVKYVQRAQEKGYLQNVLIEELGTKFEINKDLLPEGSKVLIVDDVLQSGKTLKAVEEVFESLEGVDITANFCLVEGQKSTQNVTLKNPVVSVAKLGE